LSWLRSTRLRICIPLGVSLLFLFNSIVINLSTILFSKLCKSRQLVWQVSNAIRAMVRLSQCDLVAMGFSCRNSLFTCMGKIAYIRPFQTLQYHGRLVHWMSPIVKRQIFSQKCFSGVSLGELRRFKTF